MQRNTILRRAVSLSAVLWTVLLLWTQLTPALHGDVRMRQVHGTPSVAPAATLVQAAAEDGQTDAMQEEDTKLCNPPAVSQGQPSAVQESSVQAGTSAASFSEETVTELLQEQALSEEAAEEVADESTDAAEESTTQKTVAADGEQEQPTAAVFAEDAEISVPAVSVALPTDGVLSAEDVSASNVRPLRFGATVTTYLANRQDAAVYSLQVTGRGSVVYTLGYENSLLSAAGWKLSLYEEYDPTGNSSRTSYRLLNVLSSTVASDTVSSAQIGVMPGTYRLVLEVNGEYSDANVTVLADFTEENNRETEPNGSAARYNEIYPGHAMIGSSCKRESSLDTDEDWYLFRMEKDGYASYSFTHAPTDMVSVGWQIFMYDEDLNEICFSNAAISEETVTGERVGLQAGIYFICVRGRVYTASDYTLTVQTKQAANYEQESNDTLENATPLPFNTDFTGMLNNRSSVIDYDRYKLVLPKPGSLELSFSHAIGEDDYDSWNIQLCNENGDILFADISNRLDTGCVSPQLGVPAGTYYVTVDSDNLYFTNEEYKLRVNYNADRNFETEPNNTPQTANELQQGQKISGALMQSGLAVDKDVFRLTVHELSVVRLTFSQTPSELDRHAWSVTVTNADGSVLSPIDEAGQPITDENGAVLSYLPVYSNDEQTQAIYTLAPGDYYFHVSAGLYFTDRTYTLLAE